MTIDAKTINEHIDAINRAIKKYHNEEINLITEKGFRVTCRFIIEGVVKKLYNKKPTEYFNNTEYTFYYSEINCNLHPWHNSYSSQLKISNFFFILY